jgi:tRNA dimethylallyltransferase
MKKNKVIIVAGPTATGKTSTSIEIANVCGGEIVNFDSLLFYKELNIGTAKPSTDEMNNIPHFMIDTHSAKNAINAADYIKLALPVIKDIHARNKTAVLVGGSGFYLQALLHGMYESTTTSPSITLRSSELYKESGIKHFLEILKEHDQDSFERYHENDHYRVRRAVEHFWMTGKSFSSSRLTMEERKKNSPMVILNWDMFFCYLDLPKDQHFEIIEKRSQEMWKNGLVQEVEKLLNSGFTGEEKPLKSIGYKETIDFIKGSFTNKDEYLERLCINTRQLAKAQRTWFKKLEKNEYHSIKDKDKLKKDLDHFLQGQ